MVFWKNEGSRETTKHDFIEKSQNLMARNCLINLWYG